MATRGVSATGVAGALLLGALSLGACSASSLPALEPGVIRAVGVENEYANVIGQIGGRYVRVSSVLANPRTDPHTFEASPSVAQEVSSAQLIVQNGLGYDSFINKIESAAPNPRRKVVVAQHVLGLPDSTRNPHLWYDPKTMSAVASVIATDLAGLAPIHKAYFEAHLEAFDASMRRLLDAISSFKATYPASPVAVTEPVADYLLSAMGMRIVTPFVFQAAAMNGVDPSAQEVSVETALVANCRASVFVYNAQVVDSLTISIRRAARSAGVPVVAVYETMPTPHYDYQSWMLAEIDAIRAAVEHGTSTEHL